MSRDHIPPRKLFPQPWTDDLITVAACGDCNNQSSADDEYFIWMVTMSAKAVGHEAVKARQQRLSMHASDRRRRMATNVLKATRRVEVTTPAGLYLGHATGYNVDLVRVNRVLERIVRGLYFVEREVRAPEEAVVFASAEPPPGAFHPDTIQALLQRGERSVANGAFQYWFSEVDDHPTSALVLMRFFENVLALGFVLDAELHRQTDAEPVYGLQSQEAWRKRGDP
jgi:hypothetical protein